ncbi:MAG: heme-copper oxidase subunit III [Proteobacteria bacterium]|nr:heme-copper oxidase subunit III [Pseudomonadota bacterium]
MHPTEVVHHHKQTNTGVDDRKLGMWILIISECFLFGTLITNFLIHKKSVKPGTPGGIDVFDIEITTWSTFVLLMSSVAMVLALQACKNRALRPFQFWTFLVALGGLIFLGFQYYEFSHFLHNDFGFTTNLFASSFFLLTGCHGLHVLVGTLWLSTIGITSLIRGDRWFSPVSVEIAGLYWHFVDVVWIVIFTVVYLYIYL